MIKVPYTVPRWVAKLFFVVGLIAAVALRAIIVFSHINPSLVRPFWYVGVIGYMIFFLYRYKISNKRKKAIKDHGLIKKIKEDPCYNPDDKKVLLYLLHSLSKSKENLNYLFIFGLSLVAIVLDIYLSL